MTTCGACKRVVDQAEHRDAHDPKVCVRCREELPVDRFARHPSSGDGRRQKCIPCTSVTEAQGNIASQARRDADRRALNARFAKRGYRWVSCDTAKEHGHRFDLLDPAGRIVNPRAAEIAIGRIEQDENPSWGDYDY